MLLHRRPPVEASLVLPQARAQNLLALSWLHLQDLELGRPSWLRFLLVLAFRRHLGLLFLVLYQVLLGMLLLVLGYFGLVVVVHVSIIFLEIVGRLLVVQRLLSHRELFLR